MRILLTLLRKDIANMTRNRTAMALTFLVPVAMIYIFGQVFGINKPDSGPRDIDLAVANECPDPAAQKLIAALRAEKTFHVITTFKNPDKTVRPLTEADARQMIHDRAFNYAVVIPADLLPKDRFGVRLKILSNPRNDVEAQVVNGMLQKTIFTNAPELLGQALRQQAQRFLGDAGLQRFNHDIATSIGQAFGGDSAKIERELNDGDYGLGKLKPRKDALAADPSLRRLDEPAQSAPSSTAAGTTNSPAASPASSESAPKTKPAMAVNEALARIFDLKSEQVVGKKVKSPAATRVVGGWAIMFLLFAISGSSAAFFDESNSGIFQRLLSSPVTRSQLLISRFNFGIVLGVVQLIALFMAGQIMYGVDVSGHFANLLIVCIAASAACTSFGMLVAAIAPNAGAANGLSTFLVMVMSATGGAWWPMSFMPEFMQRIGKATVVYWSMEGFSAVLWAENTLAQLLPILGVLLGIAAGIMAISIALLRRKAIFE